VAGARGPQWAGSRASRQRSGWICLLPGATGSGLINQGWKDSNDSIFHADGTLAHGAIAVVEVQDIPSAAYAPWPCWPTNAATASRGPLAQAREEFAQRRRAAFLDGGCGILRAGARRRWKALPRARLKSGHLLYTGLASRKRGAPRHRRAAFARAQFGWGIRTLARDEVRYNPMSYHNGSVWPHDGASVLPVLRGMATRGRGQADERFVRSGGALRHAAAGTLLRVSRAPGGPPIAYPVACLPQAWSSGAPFMMLQACLGLSRRWFARRNPRGSSMLPIGIDQLELRHIKVGDATTDIVFQRVGERVVAFPRGKARRHSPLHPRIERKA